MTTPRQILFLQGLPGDFFNRLAGVLKAQGCEVHRVNFNGGDLWDWRHSGAVNYRGTLRTWPAFLARLLRARGITDVVLFGDCRALHRTARAIAAGLGIQVHVFEEGYLRPDWVTLERGGVNGFSPLPTDPDWCRAIARDLPPVEDGPRLPSSLRRRWRDTVIHYTAFVILWLGFPLYHTHRPWHPLVEAVGWLSQLARRGAAERRSAAATGRLRADGYFVFPLQLDSDSQLRAHSDFDGMQPALAQTLASFAAHAPLRFQIVVKAHPLDNGLVDWRGHAIDYARALGMADRLIFIESGDIDALVRGARGVVTVNSTTGTLALAAGVPVMTLGRAVYDMRGLTHQGTLADFWIDPQPPQADLYDAYCRVLADRCLLRGGFYAAEEHAPLARAAARRVLAVDPMLASAGDLQRLGAMLTAAE